jgi:transcriptional regulator with XRE-family HTH domain
MAPVSGPTVHRRQLGSELRRLRKGAGLALEQVARELDCSQTRVSRIETARGRTKPKPEEIRKLCELYSVTDERKVRMLLDMLTNSQQEGWWESYEDVLPSGLEVYVGLESDARAELAWEPSLVHGLLQTEDYARAILSAGPGNRPQDIDALVALRMDRQKLLKPDQPDDAPLELWAVLDEAVIRRPVGGAQVMKAQLTSLVESARQPNIDIQVVPSHKGAHPGLIGAFSVLEFEEDDPVIYVDSPAGNLYLEKRQVVRRFQKRYDTLRALALDPEETAALLQQAAEEMS